MQTYTSPSILKIKDNTPLRAALLSGAALAFLAVMPGPAHAGFEWTPPADNGGEQMKSIMPDPVQRTAQPPASDTGKTGQGGAAPADSKAAATSSSQMATIHADSKKDVQVESTMAPAPGSMAEKGEPVYDFKQVEGFGNDIPMALAMRQIVPATYSFSFDGVNPGKPISWSGGKGWDVILRDILKSADAKATLNGTNITISEAGDTLDGERLAIVNAPDSLIKEYKKPARTQPKPTQMASAPAPANDGQAQQREQNRGQNRGQGGPVSLVAPGDDMASTAPQRPAPQPGGNTWMAAPGERVSDILKDWTRREGVELFWNVKTDYTLEKSTRLQGSLEEVANALLMIASKSGNMQARIYPNLPDGPAVLLVRSTSPDNS
mgnify:FL=1